MDVRLERLRSHCIGLCTEVIWPEITAKGCILARDGKGSVYEDEVTTHHIVDLFHVLDGGLFSNNIRNACKWFADEQRSFADPFFLTALAQSHFFDGDAKAQVVDEILHHRRKSGSIEVFTGFLDGGTIFSTLWAVKILLLLQDQSEYQDVIHAGLRAVRERWGDIHRSSFKGFYLDLALISNIPSVREECGSICREIVKEQAEDGLWDGSVLYSAYIAGNLLHSAMCDVNKDEAIETSDRCLGALFELDKEATGMPALLKQAAKTHVESAYLQTVIRSVIAAVRRLSLADHAVALDVAIALLGTWPTLYHATGALDSRLKRMLQQYGDIEKEFQKEGEAARTLLKTSPYERNVFVMMPFRQDTDERIKNVEKIIRRELKKRGFHAWLATDCELDPDLWANIVSYMTGCKYGIAVFTRKDEPSKGTIEPDFNPNVSLELGFVVSRAKRVLILKDNALHALPSDLMGKLYKSFDLSKVSSVLPPIIRAWADELLTSEAVQPGHESSGNEN